MTYNNANKCQQQNVLNIILIIILLILRWNMSWTWGFLISMVKSVCSLCLVLGSDPVRPGVWMKMTGLRELMRAQHNPAKTSQRKLLSRRERTMSSVTSQETHHRSRHTAVQWERDQAHPSDSHKSSTFTWYWMLLVPPKLSKLIKIYYFISELTHPMHIILSCAFSTVSHARLRDSDAWFSEQTNMTAFCFLSPVFPTADSNIKQEIWCFRCSGSINKSEPSGICLKSVRKTHIK